MPKKDTNFNVDQLYNESLRSYANLDVEYTAPHETIRQEMKNDHNKYNEAIKEKYRFFSFGDACFFYE